MRENPQRYRLTHEFVLHDRADYAAIKDRFENALRTISATTIGYAPDYLAIEKVEDTKCPR